MNIMTVVSEDDLMTGHQFNLFGFGKYDEVDQLPSFLKIFNVQRFYTLDLTIEQD